MRTWQIERRKRTRHLIELGGLLVESGVANLTGGDRAIIYGALIWMTDKLKSDDREKAHVLRAIRENGRSAPNAKAGISPSCGNSMIEYDR